MGGDLGRFERARRRAAPGAICASTASSACNSSCLAWIMARFYFWPFAERPARAGAPRCREGCRCAGLLRRAAACDCMHHAQRARACRSRPCRHARPSPPVARRPRRAADLPAQIGKYRCAPSWAKARPARSSWRTTTSTQRDVAIKRVRAGLALDTPEGHFQQHFFAAEAALVGRLQHPNVVQIYDAVDDAEAPYLVMEYVPGVTLRRYCRADALLSLEQVVEIGFKCAMALGYVYRQGLIHRDVKPANILADHAQRARHRCQDQRFRQRHEPAVRAHAGLSRRLAGLHVARAAGRRCARLPRRHLRAGGRAVPPDRRARALRRHAAGRR